MRRLTTTLFLGTCALAFTGLAAQAQTVINHTQSQNTTVNSTNTVNATSGVNVGVASTAVGNTVNTFTDGVDVDATISQTVFPVGINATADLNIGNITGRATNVATSYANSDETLILNGRLDFAGSQVVANGATVLALGNTDSTGNVGSFVSTSTAAGNIEEIHVADDDSSVTIDQSSGANTTAVADVNIGASSVNDSAAIATATNNTLTYTSTAGKYEMSLNQKSTGQTFSTANASAINANGLSATSTATGSNFYGTHNAGEVDITALNQSNTDEVGALAIVNANIFTGGASGVATGVGNNWAFGGYVDNVSVTSSQSNTAQVASQVDMIIGDGNGGTGAIISTAMGNSLAADGCGGCSSGVANYNTNQSNSGNAEARSYSNVANFNNFASTTTAVGNNASFTSFSQ